MIYLKSMLRVIDNSGAQMAECIKVLRKGSPKSPARVGDKVVCVVQKARPLTQNITGTSNTNRVKKGDIVHAVIVRTKQKNSIRSDGSAVSFGDNACVLINKNSGEPLGSRIMANDGCVSRELREKGFNKICSLASRVV
ncbi:LADA_0E04412g1_1 [Lachancea dasiensis]|uniref:Large ribosomal subunit protein uL14m n=1 Tax=Lachancea dasiensis TaxID=1072105 RepID=A0A1G4JBP8_9SACH|nr:LADA_0E04412g1_1 [Lachancea dasiensis]